MGDRGIDGRKIGCVPLTLHEWVKKAEVDRGKCGAVTPDVANEMKALLVCRSAKKLDVRRDPKMAAIGACLT